MSMKLARTPIDRTCAEIEVIHALLSLDGKQILELGCGRAELTRLIATAGHDRHVVALEVDEIQHARNGAITDLDNVVFKLGGAEDIPAANGSIDVVFMFKSLHHVPPHLMAQSIEEIARVLHAGGYAYFSEPIFAGDFNEILRLFHDEQTVRDAAFRAVRHAVDSGKFRLVDEVFFNAPIHFEDFSDFDQQVIGATHSDHQLSAELYEQVRERFNQHVNEDGAHFAIPIRVDLLQKPNKPPC